MLAEQEGRGGATKRLRRLVRGESNITAPEGTSFRTGPALLQGGER